MKKFLLTVSSVAAAAIFLNSCGSSDSSEGVATGGPSGTSSFAGAVVSFNPTLTFGGDGTLGYVNTDRTSAFPFAPASAPATGSYSYTSDSDFGGGTLTITLPTLNGGYRREIAVTNFRSNRGLVRGFTLTFASEGQFDATIRSGTIASAGPPSDGGGSGGGGGGGGATFSFGADGNLVAGTTFTKDFVSSTSTIFVDSSFPTPFPQRSLGQMESFTIASNGNFEFLGVDPSSGGSYTISVPFTQAQSGQLSYRGFDTVANGTIIVTFEAATNGTLSLRWEEDVRTGGAFDFDQQIFQ